MDNNDFEQQFKQQLNSKPSSPNKKTIDSSRPITIVAIILAVIVLIESAVTFIVLINYFSIINSDVEESIQSEPDSLSEVYYNYFAFNDEGDLTAVNLTCTNEDGTSYVLDFAGDYELLNSDKTVKEHGEYSITNASLFALSNNGKVLYYNGDDIADGTRIYTCDYPDL